MENRSQPKFENTDPIKFENKKTIYTVISRENIKQNISYRTKIPQIYDKCAEFQSGNSYFDFVFIFVLEVALLFFVYKIIGSSVMQIFC